LRARARLLSLSEEAGPVDGAVEAGEVSKAVGVMCVGDNSVRLRSCGVACCRAVTDSVAGVVCAALG